MTRHASALVMVCASVLSMFLLACGNPALRQSRVTQIGLEDIEVTRSERNEVCVLTKQSRGNGESCTYAGAVEPMMTFGSTERPNQQSVTILDPSGQAKVLHIIVDGESYRISVYQKDDMSLAAAIYTGNFDRIELLDIDGNIIMTHPPLHQ